MLAAAFVTVFVTLPVAAALIGVIVAWARGKLPKDDPTKWPTLAVVVLVLGGSVALVRWLLRGVLAADRHADDDPRGWVERFADAHPAWFSRVLSFNGFGLRRLDFHGAREDGTSFATVWITCAFLPVAPVRRERVRPGSETGGTVLLAWWLRRRVDVLERVPLEGRRNVVVALLYWLLFLPLLVGPTFAGLAYTVATRPPGSVFWPGAAAVLALGVVVFAIEERLAATPPRPRVRG